jgi:hypothetical protein
MCTALVVTSVYVEHVLSAAQGRPPLPRLAGISIALHLGPAQELRSAADARVPDVHVINAFVVVLAIDLSLFAIEYASAMLHAR